jgi:hypothetical protein
MPIVAEQLAESATDAPPRRFGATDFGFAPNELAQKCRSLIESYHTLHGYACLLDMIWLCGAQDFIARHEDFRSAFRSAVKQRVAKRANDSFVLIATTICALEVLVRDLAGWGARFPIARREAERLLAEDFGAPRLWLLDMYLYPDARRQAVASPSRRHSVKRRTRPGRSRKAEGRSDGRERATAVQPAGNVVQRVTKVRPPNRVAISPPSC